jgi:hypothetical protein
VNPTGILPISPQIDFAAPLDRARLNSLKERAAPEWTRRAHDAACCRQSLQSESEQLL